MNENTSEPTPAQHPGELLRAARERRGMTLAQVADQLRLSPQVIEALEQGNFAFIGAQVFVRGYIRRYAELVGEGAAFAETALQRHDWSVAAVDLTSTRLRALAGTADRRRIGHWPFVALAVLALGAAAWWWARRASAPRPGPAPTELVQEQVLAPPALDGSQPPAAADEGEAPAGTSAAAAPAAAQATAPAARPVVAPPAAQPAKPAATPATKPPAPAASAAAAAGGTRHQLRLSWQGASWTEVYDATGARLFYELGGPGDTRSVAGTPPFRIVLGNPSGVTAAFDGAALALPAPRAGTTLRASIDARGQLAQDR